MRRIIFAMVLVACAAFGAVAQRPAPSAGGRPAPADPGVPNPALVLTGLDTGAKGSDGKPYIGVNLFISNYAKFPAFLFAPAPELAPCGTNKNSPRAWLRVFDAKAGKEIYTHCALTDPTALRTLSFNVERPGLPAEIYVALEDRAAKKIYKSNCVRTADGKPCEEVTLVAGGAAPTPVVPAGVPLAFWTVLGRAPAAPEGAQWEAEKQSKQMGQTQLNQALLAWLTTAPDAAKVAEIKQVVGRAFKAAGKAAPPTQEGTDYWANRIMARTAYYQIILDALKQQ